MKKPLFAIVILLLSVLGIRVQGQVDTEFWFVAPEITIGHGNFPGGEPVYFRVSALELDATVRIYQPANNAGMDTTFTVPARTTLSFDASPWIDDLENKPGGFVLNKGIHITSSNLITVYYDVDEYWNQDIYSLKGKNALGLEFYTPMQNIWNNGNYNPVPYSGIDIVATMDNTQITITPTVDLVGGFIAGVPFSVTLNRGETFSCTAITKAAADHPAGTHIVANKAVAVTLKDDSVKGAGCNDQVGDQAVPMVNSHGDKIVGHEYIVMRGKLNLIDPNALPPDPVGVPTGERVFIMATEPNTEVFIDGVSLGILTNPGQQIDYQIRNNSTHVRGDKPIMVFHVSGFGCEMGGAILPSIDGCTGSTEVSFTRSTTRDFYLNIMTMDAAKHAFTMHYEDGSTFVIPETWFEPVGVTDYVCLKNSNKLFNNNRWGGVPQGEVVRITNSVSVFQLGLIEGGTTSGCKYGYFSEYGTARGHVVLVESGAKSQFVCAGDSVQMRASGGISYSWSPADYLDDPYSATPIAKPPSGIHNYDVTIHRGCLGDTVMTVIMGIAEEVEARFEADKWDVSSQEVITFENQSSGVDMSSNSNVQWDFDWEDNSNPLIYDTSPTLQHSYNNSTGTVEQKIIQLVVYNDKGCTSEIRKTVNVHPDIRADFSLNFTEGCSPVEIEFQNLSSGAISHYAWDFGDGTTSTSAVPTLTHTYTNNSALNLIYQVRLVVFNEGGYSDTLTADITVYPEITSQFASDVTEGCDPVEVAFTNQSSSSALAFLWEFGDGETTDLLNPMHLFTNPASPDPQSYEVKLIAIGSGNCKDTSFQTIVVQPYVKASFDMDSDICHLTDIPIRNNSVGADVYMWDFGDGSAQSTSSDPELQHYYINVSSSPVNYTVELTVENDEGCSDQLQKQVVVYPDSEGGRLKGTVTPITYGSSTGDIYLSAHIGEVVRWQKIVKAGPWEDIDHKEIHFSEIPASADLWQYRAVVQSGACEETSSDLFSLFVSPKELVITPTPEQTKRAGDPDPDFTFTNSEWNDNSRFTGTLDRMQGESPGRYSFKLGNLSAGSNYSLIMNPQKIKFIIAYAVGMEEYQGGKGLRLTSHGNPIQESSFFTYSLPFDGSVSLSIRNMAGQVVKTVVNNKLETRGDYHLSMGEFDLDAGIYFATLMLKSDQEATSCTIKLVKSK